MSSFYIWGRLVIHKIFELLRQIACSLSRTKALYDSSNYSNSKFGSIGFCFPNDLRILKLLSKLVIQLKASSRLGIFDLCLNKIRVLSIEEKFIEIIPN